MIKTKNKVALSFLILSLVLSNASAFAISTVEDRHQWMAQLYIANQIKGIGLVDSYREDNSDTSYVYDNALAAIVCLAMNNFGLAEEILDTLCLEVRKTYSGLPYEKYFYNNTSGTGSGVTYAGNSAWLLQAMNIYQKKKNSTKYASMQQALADFLVSLQDPNDGGLRGSASDYWKSTEHNMIAYRALRNFGRLNNQPTYITSSNKIRNFLISPAVWDGTRFNRGPWDSTNVTDVQPLGVLLLGNAYASVLTWAESTLKVSMPYGTTTVTGFDFNDDLDTVWIEGTLQMAFAFFKAGDKIKASYYYYEACKTRDSTDGSLLLATNTGTASDWWMLQPWRAIAPTCWIILYRLKFNPLVAY